MTILDMMQTTGALSGLVCLMIALFAAKKQLKLYARR